MKDGGWVFEVLWMIDVIQEVSLGHKKVIQEDSWIHEKVTIS